MTSGPRLRYFGPFTFDLVSCRLITGTGTVGLGDRAARLMQLLVERAGQVVSSAELMAAGWPGRIVEDSNLQVQILSLRKIVGTDAIVTSRGHGYRFVLPLREQPVEPAIDDGSGRGSGLDQPVFRYRTTFVGRDEDLSRIADLRRTARLLTLVGPGGVGKTRLAVEALSRDVSALSRIHAVDIAALAAAPSLADAIADAFGCRGESQLTELARRVCARVGAQPAFLFLDNCEHLREACGEVIDELMSRCPSLRVMATSREPLGLADEQLLTVHPLGVPVDNSLDGAKAAESVQMFLGLARLQDPQFELGDGTFSDVAGICRRLDGLPLALELAAAQAGLLPIAEIHRQVSYGIDVLRRDGGRGRHPSMDAALAWSFEALSEVEQTALCRLSIFAGGFDVDAVGAVAVDETDSTTAIQVLRTLRRKSLIVVDVAGDGDARFRLLEPVRIFAASRLEARGDSAATLRQHVDHYLHFVHKSLATPTALWAFLRREQANVDRALRTALEQSDAVRARRLVAALYVYWIDTNQARAKAPAARQAIALPGDGVDDVLWRRALVGAAQLALHSGDAEQALRLADEVVLASQTPVRGEEPALYVRGLALCEQGRYEDAIGCFDSLRAWAESVGDELRWIQANGGLGEALRACGRPADAAHCYGQSLDRLRQFADIYPGALAAATCNLALARIEAGDLDGIAECLLDSFSVARSAGVDRIRSLLLEATASVAAHRGDTITAARLLGAASAMQARTGQHPTAADVTFGRAVQVVCRSALGSVVFEESHAAGARLESTSAVDEAVAWLDEAPARPELTSATRERARLRLWRPT